MCFPTCSALGSFFLVFSFILEIFLIIGQVSNRWFLTQIFFAETWNRNRNLSYSFSLWNYCTGDGDRNIQSCSHPTPAYNWAQTPDIVDLVPDLANSKRVHGVFYALFILIFISMGLNFIFWVMSIPIVCTKHKRGWGYSMSTLCLINFLITLVCVILSLVLVLAGVRQITHASPDWQAHAGNALWLMIGVCISNLIALFCYSGGTCCSRKYSSRDDEYDHYHTNGDEEANTKAGCFACCGRRRKNKAQVDPVDKEYTTSDKYNSLLPDSAQPIHSPNNVPNQHVYSSQTQPTTTLQQPYVVSSGTGTSVPAQAPLTEREKVQVDQSYSPIINNTHAQN